MSEKKKGCNPMKPRESGDPAGHLPSRAGLYWKERAEVLGRRVYEADLDRGRMNERLERYRGIAMDMIAHYRTVSDGPGCSFCGGVPHANGCFVGRCEFALKADHHKPRVYNSPEE